MRNGVLNARPGHVTDAQLGVSGPKQGIVGLLLQPAKAGALIDAGAVKADGDDAVLEEYASVVEEFDPAFDLVTP